MGLLQRAVETYEANTDKVGEYTEGQSPLAPIGHILTNANIEITLDKDGNFVGARKVEKTEPKILIPVTEESGGRTSGLSAHPLCEQLKYAAPKNKKAHELYLGLLGDWKESSHSHPFLGAILTYLQGGEIIDDLAGAGIVSEDKYDEKALVAWRVRGIDGEQECCWKNKNLFKAYGDYYRESRPQKAELCMLDGVPKPVASQHTKGIIPINGNAKLISANDSSGFTYRGRFSEDWQASTLSYDASQKAHNAIAWLASNQGVREFSGNRIFLCWNPKGVAVPRPMRPVRGKDAEPKRKPSDYRKNLQSTLMSFREDSGLRDSDIAVLASFDAATTGRLAVTYYNEISLGVFLDRMHDWDAHCCWYSGKFGIQSPNLFQLVDCAFGTQRGSFLETDDKVQRQHLQRLLDCKVNGGVFPYDIVKALAQRASTPQAYEEYPWRSIVHSACSAIQKYRNDTNKGGNEMEWELNKKDRSFQYGRLLAAMERAEDDYYYKTKEDRQTSAIKAMSEFRQRPLSVFERINRHLHQAYLNRIDAWQSNRYERLVGEIFELLKEFPESEINKPLDDLYLMGYELQRNAFFTKNENNESNENIEEE